MSILKLGKDNWARTSPTKEGITFVTLSFIVGFAAINTNNNLLYLIFGVMLSLVIISGIFSMINLSRIDVKLKQTSELYALTPSYITFSFKNEKFLIPSYSLTLELDKNRSFITYLPTTDKQELKVGCFFKERGWNKIPEVILYTRFPFGFFKKWIKIDIQNKEVLVYPKLNKITIDKNIIKDQLGEIESNKTGHGEELKTIRDYTDGDNTKQIDWKNSAKTDKLMVKEFLQKENSVAEVVFNPENDRYRDLEHYISEKASLLAKYVKSGFNVEFITQDKIFKIIYNKRQMFKVFEYLALYN